MQADKATAFAFTYKEEGGYSNDAHDPGGATNLGIIQLEYNSYRRIKGLQEQSVRHITKAEADEIYTKFYWDKIYGDDIPPGIDLVMYDFAVNSGVSRSVKYAQRILSVKVDGILGPITLAALRAVDPKDFIVKFDENRLSFLQALTTWQYFGRGWQARVRRATTAALALIKVPVEVLKTEERPVMLVDVIFGIVRHVIAGGGVGTAALSGFDVHNPLTWMGLLTFAGGVAASGIDKIQKNKNHDALSMIADMLSALNDKLDSGSDTSVKA